MKFLGTELDVFKLAICNAANTFKSSFVNSATANRIVTFPDKTFTVAGVDDINAKNVYTATSGINGLFLNGSCQDGTNSAYTSIPYTETVNTIKGNGCLLATGMDWWHTYSNNYIDLDPFSIYEIGFDALKIDGGATTIYLGIVQFDIDNNIISGEQCYRRAGSDGVLTQDLSVGDTTVYISNTTNYPSTSNTYNTLVFYEYRDSNGYHYKRAFNPYTRLVSRGDLWVGGGVSSNSITLNGAWNQPNPNRLDGKYLAGTEVACSTANFAYQYIKIGTLSYDGWSRVSGFVGGTIDLAGAEDGTRFRAGISKCRLVILTNVDNIGKTAIDNIFVYRATTTRASLGLAP